MPKTVIILISGKSESGKGTVADELEVCLGNQPNVNVIRCSLSTYVREVTKRDFFWDGIDTPESRKFMAEFYRVGTEFYPYHMARRVWERDIKYKRKLMKEKKVIVGSVMEMPISDAICTDVDFNIAIVESFREVVNYDYFMQLKEAGEVDEVLTVRVNRLDHTSTQKLTDHVSEVDLDDFKFDYFLLNDATIEKLKTDVKAIAMMIYYDLTAKQTTC